MNHRYAMKTRSPASSTGLLDIRSQGYGDDSDWHGLTHDDVLDEPDTAFISTRWQPLELWPG